MLAEGIDQQTLRTGDPALSPLRPQSLRHKIQARTDSLIDIQPAHGVTLQAQIVVAQEPVAVQRISVLLPLLALGFIKSARLILLAGLRLKLIELLAQLVSSSFSGFL